MLALLCKSRINNELYPLLLNRIMHKTGCQSRGLGVPQMPGGGGRDV
jgi:hypothetical protein